MGARPKPQGETAQMQLRDSATCPPSAVGGALGTFSVPTAACPILLRMAHVAAWGSTTNAMVAMWSAAPTMVRAWNISW